MNQIQRILEDLRLSEEVASSVMESESNADIKAVNLDAIAKRKEDLTRRLSFALNRTQSDLIEYKIKRTESDKYPAAAVARAILGFQELVTSIFDALKSSPKQQYRPSVANVELSSLNLAIAKPGSVIISMTVENDRLLAVKSELDRTFELVDKVLHAENSEAVRGLVGEIGVASITKASMWAANCVQFGLDTEVSVSKDLRTIPTSFAVSKFDAQKLKELISAQSDQTIVPYQYDCELVGIDVDTSYFHLKVIGGESITGKLSETFPRDRQWIIHKKYHALVYQRQQLSYATGEEKSGWLLSELSELADGLLSDQTVRT